MLLACRNSFIKLNKRPWIFSLISSGIVMILTLTGCSGPTTSSSTQFVAGNTNTMTASQIAYQFRQLQTPGNKALYEKARAVSLADVYTSALDLAADTPIMIGGHSFENSHDLLAEHANDLQMISDNYGTVGSFMDATGLTDLTDITPEQIQASYDILDEVINHGAAGSIHTASASDTSAVTAGTSSAHASSMKGLGLAVSWGCIGSAFGALGATIGAAAACVGTGGALCGAATFGAVAAGSNAVNACKDPVTNLFKKKSKSPEATTDDTWGSTTSSMSPDAFEDNPNLSSTDAPSSSGSPSPASTTSTSSDNTPSTQQTGSTSGCSKISSLPANVQQQAAKYCPGAAQ